jgi:hypothetical protein
MLQHIIVAFGAHRINSIAKYFYQRDADTEETLCVPWTETTSGRTRTSLYTIRYPEYKASQERWALRQTGVYHMLDLDSGKSVYILLEPTAKSGLREAVQTHLRDNAGETRRDPMWLHSLLFSTYLPSWRDYLLSIEVEFLPLANSAFANYIEQNLLVGHDDLGTLYRLRYRAQQMPVILEHLTDLLGQMRSYTTAIPGSAINEDIRDATIHNLSQLERESTNSARTAKYLHGRIQSTIDFLSTTLTLRDQVVAKEQNVIMMQQNRTTVEQNNNMIRLNKSAVFITAVTLVYLPSSWLGVRLTGSNNPFFAFPILNFEFTDHCSDLFRHEFLRLGRDGPSHCSFVHDLDLHSCIHTAHRSHFRPLLLPAATRRETLCTA